MIPAPSALQRIVRIEDAQDPRIGAYRDVRERDLVGRQGLFVAEGEVVVRMLAAATSRFAAVSLLLADKRVGKLADLIAGLGPDVAVYAAPQAVMDAVAGFAVHRGVLALGRRTDPPSAQDLLAGLGPRALVLGLCAIANHDNMGGLFRCAAAFGADAVVLDSDCCDPLYRKAVRVASGAMLTTPYARLAPGADMVGLLAGAGFTALALSPAGAVDIDQAPRPQRRALLMGAEGPGLPEAVLARSLSLRIPMAAGFDSLNVAVAAGIALHRLRD